MMCAKKRRQPRWPRWCSRRRKTGSPRARQGGRRARRAARERHGGPQTPPNKYEKFFFQGGGGGLRTRIVGVGLTRCVRCLCWVFNMLPLSPVHSTVDCGELRAQSPQLPVSSLITHELDSCSHACSRPAAWSRKPATAHTDPDPLSSAPSSLPRSCLVSPTSPPLHSHVAVSTPAPPPYRSTRTPKSKTRPHLEALTGRPRAAPWVPPHRLPSRRWVWRARGALETKT